MYDLAVVGMGPAGLAGALNARVRNKSVIIFGLAPKALTKSESIRNCLGFFNVKGADLYDKFLSHLEYYKPKLCQKRVGTVYSMGDYFALDLGEGEMETARACLIATGANIEKSLPGEDKFFAKGLSYCATCDAALYRGKSVVILGYNDESFQEANFACEIVGKVTFVNLTGQRKNLSPKIKIIEGKKPKEFLGDKKAQALIFDDGSKISADGFFIIKDSSKPDRLVPSLKLAGNFIEVNRKMETNIKGLYAAGDVTGTPFQIQKALGEGQVAGLSAASYLSGKANKR